MSLMLGPVAIFADHLMVLHHIRVCYERIPEVQEQGALKEKDRQNEEHQPKDLRRFPVALSTSGVSCRGLLSWLATLWIWGISHGKKGDARHQLQNQLPISMMYAELPLSDVEHSAHPRPLIGSQKQGPV